MRLTTSDDSLCDLELLKSLDLGRFLAPPLKSDWSVFSEAVLYVFKEPIV